jgi:hypothetical protein
MTAQIRELLYYKGEKYYLSTEPLQPLLDIIAEDKPTSKVVSTDCWTGYLGTWEIVEDKLYLIGLKGYPDGNDQFNMDFLFPNKDKVHAEWFTGEIKIPQGKMLHYEHMGYMSIFEKDIFIKIEKGIMVSTREVDNSKTFNPDDPMGWKKLAIELYKINLKKGNQSKP